MGSRRRVLIVATLVVALPLVALGAVLAFGPTLDLSAWRETLAARASESLGRTVGIDGPLEVTLGRTVGLRAVGVRVANPPAFDNAGFARLGELRAAFDLVAALQARLVVRSVEATDVRVRLLSAADGTSNWTFPARGTGGPPTDPVARRFSIDVEDLTLRRVEVEHARAGTSTRYALALDELRATGGWDGPLSAAARGRTARGQPYAVELSGGALRALVEGASAWPCTVDLEVAGARLHASGEAVPGERTLRFLFGAGADDLAAVEPLLGVRLPEFGVAALSGRVVARADRVEVSGLRGVLGTSEFAGRLSFAGTGDGARAVAELDVTTLDVRPFLRPSARDTGRALAYDDLADSPIELRGLVPAGVSLRLRVEQVSGAGAAVRDASVQMTSDENGWRAPFAFTVADVPVAGRAEVDTSGATPSVRVEAAAHGTRLGELALSLFGLRGIDGELRQIALRVAGRGETLGAAVRDTEARLEATGARLGYGNLPNGRPVAVALDTLVVDAPRGRRIQGSARGTLLGKAVRVAFRGPELQRVAREGPLPADLDVAAGGVKARIEARAPGPGPGRFARLAFSAEAARSGDLAPWLAVARNSALPVSARGELRFPADGWELHHLHVRVGRCDLSGELRGGGARAGSGTVARLESAAVDVAELGTLRETEDGARTVGGTPGRRRGNVLELPILPQGLHLADADVDLRVARVVLPSAEVRDVGLEARVREGRLPPAPFAATVAGVRLSGTLALDLRAAAPEAAVVLQASDVDVGRLLSALRLADDIDAHAGALEVAIHGHGDRLGDFLESASFQARLRGGEVAVRGPANRIAARMRLDEGLVRAAPGQLLEARLVGYLDDAPIELSMSSARLYALLRGATRVPLRVQARAAGATLGLEGEVDLPLGRGGHLRVAMAGERLDSLSGLAGVALPPWGPWSLEGPISATATGYSVGALVVRVGESRLHGSGTLDITGARPRFDMRLNAPHVRLEDFPRERPATPAEGLTIDAVRGQASATATQAQRLLGAQLLRRFDAYVDVRVERVTAGRDMLGDGELRLQLEDGRLQIGPAVLRLSGGSVTLAAEYDAAQGRIRLALGAHSEEFDYGVLARRDRPDSDTEGRFSLDLTLTGEAASLDAILASANGRLEFVAWPRSLGASQVDIWVVNVVRWLLPFVQRGEPSVVNCIVGRFDLVDGKLRDEVFIVDTTRVRVFGTGGIDFATEAIDFRFSPRVKRLSFGAIEPPIRVTGTLSNFRRGFTGSDFVATVQRFFTSLVIVPLQTLIRGPIPADGRDICGTR